MIRDLINKTFSLGIGAAVTSKEQIEKLVDELVKKGEVTQAESRNMVDELMKKGDEARAELEQQINLKVKQRLAEMDLATKEDIERLENRIALLEAKNLQ
jgi:polyhydroxyalkanoate synthesis regulator phasin